VPLHANALNIGGRAVAFMGHSGAGKSTMAAWFESRGYAVLTDDVCAVEFGADGRAIAQPGIPRLRLWKEALAASGRASGQYERSFDTDEKFDVPTARNWRTPIDLGMIYLLKRTPAEGEASSIRRLFGVEALEALVANTYRGSYLQPLGQTGRHLKQCIKLVQGVPVFEACREWGYHVFEREARALEEHARQEIETRA
jgi:hypothetical protein